MQYIFRNNFYHQFRAPNAKEFEEKINSEELIDNNKFSWGENCKVNRIPVRSEEYLEYITPSLNIFLDTLNLRVDLSVGDPWINIYNYNDYQEIHDHWEEDIACVFFPKNLENFSKFYFRDRNNTEFSDRWRKIMNIPDIWYPEIESGDIIFFPAHMLHGVSPHNSNIVRKTFSCNFKIVS